MATITKKITLTEKNDTGPLYDLYWSSDGGGSFTSSVDSRNLYLPFVGSSTVANVDSTANAFKLQSNGVCTNFVLSGSIGPTPTPTATPTPTPAEGYCTRYICEDQFGGYVYYTNCSTGLPAYQLINPYPAQANICSRTYPTFETVYGTVISSTPNCGSYPLPTPTPTSTSTPTPTATAGTTPTPTPTPTPAWVQYSAHNIVKSSLYQHKSVWFGSSNMYQAQQLVTYLTGQSVPATSTPYSLSNANYKIYDSTNVERGSWSSASGTAMYYFDGIDAVVQVDNIFISGTYLNGSSSTYDTWQYSKL